MLTRPRIRQLGLGELLDESFRLYRNNFLTFVAITALIIVPYFLVNFVVQYPMQSQLAELQAQANQGFNGSPLPELMTFYGDLMFWYVGIIAVSLLYSVFFQPLLEGGLVYAISQRYQGHATSVGESLGAALRRSPSLIGARLIPTLIGLMLSGGFVGLFALIGYQSIMQVASGEPDMSSIATLMALGMVGIGVMGVLTLVGIAIMVRIFFTSQAAMVEQTGPWESLVRSLRLTQDYFWRTLGYWLVIWFLGYILMLIPGMVLMMPMAILQVDPRIQLIVSTAIGGVFAVIIMPFNLIAYTLMYYDLRVRKEGFDLEQQAQSLMSPGIPMSALESR